MDEIEQLQRYHEARYRRRLTEEELRAHIKRETGGERVLGGPDNRPPWMKIAQIGDAPLAWGSAGEDG